VRFLRGHPVALGILVFAGGAIVGAVAWALASPIRTDIPPEVQSGALVMAGAILAGAFAFAAAVTGGSFAAEGARDAAEISSVAILRDGAATREATRLQVVRDQKAILVRRIVSLGHRHAQEVAVQIAARQAKAGTKGDPKLPDIGSTHPIEDAVNELYTLGAQHTADLAWQMLRSLWELDKYAFRPGDDVTDHGEVKGLNEDSLLDADIWREVQLAIKTMVIEAHLQDVGGEPLEGEGTLGPGDFLWRIRSDVADERIKRRQAGAPVSTDPPWLAT
jgi:hypothetical protein